MPRRYSPRASTPRKRIAKIKRDIDAYYVPRQGVPLKRRKRRTQAEYDEEWAGARAGWAYYNAQRNARRRAPVHARPLKKKRSFWQWLVGR